MFNISSKTKIKKKNTYILESNFKSFLDFFYEVEEYTDANWATN